MTLLDKIIISGDMGAGKDEIAKYLIEKHGFVQVSFAEPIYWIARNIFRMKTKNRKLLQNIGEGGRALWNDIWVYLAFRKIKRLIKEGRRVVVSDLRRENEYKRAMLEGFLPIRVTAYEDTRIDRMTKRDGFIPCPYLMYNSSETGAYKFDMITIPNNGTIEELHEKIDNLVFGRRYIF